MEEEAGPARQTRKVEIREKQATKQGSPLLQRRAIAEVVHLVERQGAM